jgi:hypothetical protein
MIYKASSEKAKLTFFCIFICFITYGFALTNYSLTIDSETPILDNFSMGLGRWGTNLIRYHVFHGHLPYFTLLLGLVLMALTATELTKLFRLRGVSAYLFCALFLSFPQMAYQLMFTMQADVVPLGFFCSAVAVNLLVQKRSSAFSLKSIGVYLLAALLLMFVISIYQALVFIPLVCYLFYFLHNTFQEDFNLRDEFKGALQFAGVMALALVLYVISVKAFCPPVEEGYLSTYVSGEGQNRWSTFFKLWKENLSGKAYYGEWTFILTPIVALALAIKFVLEKKRFVYRFIALLLALLLPFLISFFITNGYNPPRIYVTSGIVFAFVVVQLMRYLRTEKVMVAAGYVICMTHVYFISMLFYSNYKIFNYDKDIAHRIDATIYSRYPQFDPNNDYVYFFGGLPHNHHDKFRVPNSEAFGGSLLAWDNGNNYRIINFFKFTGIDYRMLDNKESFLKAKDSIAAMPTWPSPESVRKIGNVVVVKLNNEKGLPLPIE